MKLIRALLITSLTSTMTDAATQLVKDILWQKSAQAHYRTCASMSYDRRTYSIEDFEEACRRLSKQGYWCNYEQNYDRLELTISYDHSWLTNFVRTYVKF